MECACHSTQNSVLITYMLIFKSIHLILPCLPFYNAVIIFVGDIKVSISRMLCPPNDCLRNRRHRWEIHVCNPHRNIIQSIPHLNIFPYSKRIRKKIHSKRIFAFSVNNSRKIVFHCKLLQPYCFILYTHIPRIWLTISAYTHLLSLFFLLKGSLTRIFPSSYPVNTIKCPFCVKSPGLMLQIMGFP